MKRQKHQKFLIVVIAVNLWLLLSPITGTGQTKEGLQGQTISLGLVSIVFQKEIEDHFRDFVGYVARRLSPTSDLKGRVVVASTALQMIKLLDQRRVDFYMESPYPTYLINKQGAAVIILRRWKGGLAEYRSLIFAKKNSGVARLEDLRGKMIAFEDSGSTSAYFLPKILLLKKGFKVTEKPGTNAKVAPNEVGYVFASSDRTIVDLVLANQTAAGAISDDDYGTLDDQKKSAITILTESERLPRHLVSVRKDLDSSLKNRLTDILLSMHEDLEGRKILFKADNTTKFDRLPGGEPMVRRKFIELFRPRPK